MKRWKSMNDELVKKIEYSSKYIHSFKKLPGSIQQKARQKEIVFRRAPFNPQLKTHKLHGRFRDYWSYSVDFKYRVIFSFPNSDKALFFDIGLHPIYQGGE